MKLYEIVDLVFHRSPKFRLEIGEFSLEKGEKVAVTGPNGSGKTTLLRLLSFLEQPDSFTRFLFRGGPLGAGSRDRKRLGFLQQQPFLFRGTVAENLAYPLELRGLPAMEVRGRVAEMLAQMRLDDLAGARAGEISHGEQKRLALGRVLIGHPDILLLDEPVAHLDHRSRTVMEDLLANLPETILLTSHDLEFAHRVAGRVVTLQAGRLSGGLPLNLMEGKMEGGYLLAGPGLKIKLSRPGHVNPDGWARVTVDPRKLAVSLETPTSDHRIILEGRISSVRAQGDEVWMEVDCGRRLTAIFAREAYEQAGLNVGKTVVVSFDGASAETL